MVGELKVMDGTRAFELLDSKKPEDQKTAKRLMEFTRKAENSFYVYETMQKLRNEFKDVM